MKSSAYAGFLAWGLVALGAEALWRRAQRLRPAVLALALVPLLLAAWAQALTVGDHWRGSANFTRDMAAIEDGAQLVPPGATIAISGDSTLTGLNSGLISSALYGREIWGHFMTAYSRLSYWPDGRMPQYAVLAADERAWPLDLGGRELWRSAAAAIYQLDPQALALLGRSDLYSTANVNKFSPAALDIQRRSGAFRSAEPGAPLTLLLGDTLRFGPGQPPVGGAGALRLDLELASLAAQRVTITSNDTSAAFDLAAGVTRISLPTQAPASVTITSEQSLALISAIARPADGTATPAAVLDQGQVAWSASVRQAGPAIQLHVPIANPGRHALRVGLSVVEDTYDRSRTLLDLLGAAPLDGAWQLNVDPVRGATEALIDGKATPLLDLKATSNPPDGSYFGVLTVYEGAQIVAHAPVFTFSISGGKLAAFAPQPFSVEATPAGPPPAPLPSNQRALLETNRSLDGAAAELAGAVLTRTPAWPGAPTDAPIAPGSAISVQLYWQARAPNGQPLMISAQVLGTGDRKWAQWDGALGGDWRPIQSWQAGDRVRQDVPLQLDPATPPGHYRLALVAYDPATGQAVPLGGENMLQLGELEVR